MQYADDTQKSRAAYEQIKGKHGSIPQKRKGKKQGTV